MKVAANRGEILVKFSSQESDAIFRFLKVVATNVVTDYVRNREAARRSVRKTVALDPALRVSTAAPALEGERRLLLLEIDGILKKRRGPSSARDRYVFWLYYRYGLTAKDIGSLVNLGLGTKGVETV